MRKPPLKKQQQKTQHLVILVTEEIRPLALQLLPNLLS